MPPSWAGGRPYQRNPLKVGKVLYVRLSPLRRGVHTLLDKIPGLYADLVSLKVRDTQGHPSALSHARGFFGVRSFQGESDAPSRFMAMPKPCGAVTALAALVCAMLVS